MKKIGPAIWIVLLTVTLTILYQIKHQVREIHKDINHLHKQMAEEEETLHILRAEWSYLNRPERLASLTRSMEEVGPVTPVQIASVDKIPFPPQPPVPALEKPQPPISTEEGGSAPSYEESPPTYQPYATPSYRQMQPVAYQGGVQ